MDLSRQHLANHTIVVGKTGSGKSTLMENVAVVAALFVEFAGCDVIEIGDKTVKTAFELVTEPALLLTKTV